MPAARLPHRLQRHCRRSIVVRVEKGLGDLERAPLIVMSKDFEVLHSRETRAYKSGVCVSCCVCMRCVGNALMYKRELKMFHMGGGSRWDRYGQRGAGWVVTG